MYVSYEVGKETLFDFTIFKLFLICGNGGKREDGKENLCMRKKNHHIPKSFAEISELVRHLQQRNENVQFFFRGLKEYANSVHKAKCLQIYSDSSWKCVP